MYSVLCFMDALILSVLNNMKRVSPALFSFFSADRAASRRRQQPETLHVTVNPDVLRMLKQTGMSAGMSEQCKPSKTLSEDDIASQLW